MFMKNCFTVAHENTRQRAKPGGRRRRTVEVLPGPDCWNQHLGARAGGLRARGLSAAAGRLVPEPYFRGNSARMIVVLLLSLAVFACGDKKDSAARDQEAQKAIQEGMQKERQMYEGMQKGVEKKLQESKEEA